MIEHLFKLSENKTNVRTEVLAGVTTFLTMAYIIFVQPAVLSGKMFARIRHGFRRDHNGDLSIRRAGNRDHGALCALPDRAGTRDG